MFKKRFNFYFCGTLCIYLYIYQIKLWIKKTVWKKVHLSGRTCVHFSVHQIDYKFQNNTSLLLIKLLSHSKNAQRTYVTFLSKSLFPKTTRMPVLPPSSPGSL
jgi:hypothetical protein